MSSHIRNQSRIFVSVLCPLNASTLYLQPNADPRQKDLALAVPSTHDSARWPRPDIPRPSTPDCFNTAEMFGCVETVNAMNAPPSRHLTIWLPFLPLPSTLAFTLVESTSQFVSTKATRGRGTTPPCVAAHSFHLTTTARAPSPHNNNNAPNREPLGVVEESEITRTASISTTSRSELDMRPSTTNAAKSDNTGPPSVVSHHRHTRYPTATT